MGKKNIWAKAPKTRFERNSSNIFKHEDINLPDLEPRASMEANRAVFLEAMVLQEHDYVQRLRDIIDGFVKPLKVVLIKHHAEKGAKMLNVLNFFPVILDLNEGLLKNISDFENHDRVAEQMWAHGSQLQMYSQYASAFASSTKCLGYLLSEKHGHFADTLAKCLSKTEGNLGKHNDLRDILLLPLRHIPQYVVFMFEIVKQCETGTKVYELFKRSLVEYTQTVEHVIATIRTSRTHSVLVDVREKFAVDPHIYHPSRIYCGQGMLVKQVKDNREDSFLCILLTDRIVSIGNSGKYYWLESQIPINRDSDVRPLPNIIRPYSFSLGQHGAPNPQVLIAPSETEQKVWVEMIRACIASGMPPDSHYKRAGPSVSLPNVQRSARASPKKRLSCRSTGSPEAIQRVESFRNSVQYAKPTSPQQAEHFAIHTSPQLGSAHGFVRQKRAEPVSGQHLAAPPPGGSRHNGARRKHIPSQSNKTWPKENAASAHNSVPRHASRERSRENGETKGLQVQIIRLRSEIDVLHLTEGNSPRIAELQSQADALSSRLNRQRAGASRNTDFDPEYLKKLQVKLIRQQSELQVMTVMEPDSYATGNMRSRVASFERSVHEYESRQ
eukprot:129937_1